MINVQYEKLQHAHSGINQIAVIVKDRFWLRKGSVHIMIHMIHWIKGCSATVAASCFIPVGATRRSVGVFLFSLQVCPSDKLIG